MTPVLAAALVLGGVLALRVERVRLTRLRHRFLAELQALAVLLDRRRALLARLGEELPEVLPACHATLEALGRRQRASAEALAGLLAAPDDREAAELLADAEAGFDAALEELEGEPADDGLLAPLREQAARARERRAAVTDAARHYHARRGGGLRGRLHRAWGLGELAWVG